MNFSPKIIAAIAGAIVTYIFSQVFVKYAAECDTLFYRMMFFVPSLLAGIVNPACLTVALKGNEPNVVYGTVGGFQAILLYLALGAVFGNPFTLWHWFAVAVILCGATLLQIKPKDIEADADEPELANSDTVDTSSEPLVESGNPYQPPAN